MAIFEAYNQLLALDWHSLSFVPKAGGFTNHVSGAEEDWEDGKKGQFCYVIFLFLLEPLPCGQFFVVGYRLG